MIIFKCELCKKEYQFESQKKMEDSGIFHACFIGSISINDNICDECFKKLRIKDTVLKRQSTMAFKNWLLKEFMHLHINNGKIEKKEVNK